MIIQSAFLASFYDKMLKLSKLLPYLAKIKCLIIGSNIAKTEPRKHFRHVLNVYEVISEKARWRFFMKGNSGKKYFFSGFQRIFSDTEIIRLINEQHCNREGLPHIETN